MALPCFLNCLPLYELAISFVVFWLLVVGGLRAGRQAAQPFLDVLTFAMDLLVQLLQNTKSNTTSLPIQIFSLVHLVGSQVCFLLAAGTRGSKQKAGSNLFGLSHTERCAKQE